jgi:hypothetical protein
MDVFVSDLQIWIRIRISEFQTDTDVKADTQPPAVLAHSRRRRCAIQGFPRCIPARPSCARENLTLRTITSPSIRPFPFNHSILRFQNSPALAARTLPARRRRRLSAPLQLLLAPLLRAGVLPSSSPGGHNGGPRLHSHSNPPPSCCDSQEHSANLIRGRGQACLKAYRALVAPPPASPSDLLLNQQR